MVFKPFKQATPAKQEVEEIKKEVVKPVEQEAKIEWQVVDKLPVQEVRQITKDDGTVVNFVTIEEYLTQQANAGSQ